MILIVSAVLATSTRWWGTVAVVVLTALGVVFTIGGWGEAFGPPNANVPRTVLVVGGIVWMLLGLSLATFGARELVARLRRARTTSSAQGGTSAGSTSSSEP